MLRALWDDEFGFIVSAELVLVVTIGVLAIVVGLHAVAKAVNFELVDVAQAVSVFNQSFSYDGFQYCCYDDVNAEVAGSGFSDGSDECDCSVLMTPEPRIKTQAGGPEATTY